jgi:integrase
MTKRPKAWRTDPARQGSLDRLPLSGPQRHRSCDRTATTEAVHEVAQQVHPKGGRAAARRAESRAPGQSRRRGRVRRITPHGLRHTSATMLLTGNIRPHIVAKRLGHANATVTMQISRTRSVRTQARPRSCSAGCCTGNSPSSDIGRSRSIEPPGPSLTFSVPPLE